MTLEQLRIFVAVAEREHLTRASEALNLTQSAVSSAVAQLEAGFGVRLFDRIGRGIVLTEAGRLFLPEARAVLARAHEAEAVVRDVAGALRGSLRIAASQTVGNFWLPEKLARFSIAYPGLSLHVENSNTERAAAAVLSHAADIAVVEGAVDEPRLSVTELPGDTLLLVLPNGWPPPVSVDDWAALRFVVREAGSGTRHRLADHLAGMGLRLEAGGHIAFELPSNEAVRGAVEAGAGAALISGLVAQRAVRSGEVQGIDIGLPPRPFYALRLKERSVTRADAAFMAVLTGAG
ncbi:LysR substrate-binding domain-containing protein [Asticcacaulis sp. EMRT-3]|uniref:LysR family transcriptional regulator n=1 Tax=Asticcacaulis sp. EMRT-3 TaxID=3040349 RepID=UPI0024AF330E|nr:LysR substrate-binding domain-containing protein [Asticcacaulis sp. EMRT-3]MDI7773874.1 LysR substrate-binding domain-containing protein [Asticcacaulis sp. EMRT-3]